MNPRSRSLPSEAENLGALVAEYPVNPIRLYASRLAGFGSLGMGILTIAVGWASPQGKVTLTAMGIFLLVGGLWMLWTCYCESFLRFLVLRDGLVYQQWSRTQAIRWDEVTVLRASVRRPRGSKLVSFGVTLLRADRSGVSFRYNDGTIRRLRYLSDTIQVEVADRLLPQSIAAVDRGETLRFGVFAVSPSGIACGHTQLAWSQVDSVDWVGGEVQVRLQDRIDPWVAIAIGDVPNALVFATLTNYLLHRDRPSPSI